MDWKKLGKAIVLPPMFLLVLLIPISAVLLIGSMIYIGTKSPIAIVSYVLSAYTLTIWCFRIPHLVRWFKAFKNDNPYVKKWREDMRLRINASLYGTLTWNVLYGLFQLWLGFYHRTFWFCSIGLYYLCLAVMRFFLVRHTRQYEPGERMKAELEKYRACGWIFLAMNLTLTIMIFFMIYWNRTFRHHMITVIAMAAYTFSALAASIVSMVRYREDNSPIVLATKSIRFAAACVSMLTLTSTMLTTFSDGTMDVVSQKIMLGGVGIAVSGTVVIMAVYMIVQGSKKIKMLDVTKE